MKKRRISMIRIKEVLRLHHQHELSMRQIGTYVNVSASSVHLLLGKARKAGISWPQQGAKLNKTFSVTVPARFITCTETL